MYVSQRWIYSLVALPTYLGAFLLLLRAVGDNILFGIILLIPITAIYSLVCQAVFPNNDFAGKYTQLALFIPAQIIFWVAAFLLANQVLK